MDALFLPAISTQGNNCIRIFTKTHMGTNAADRKTFTEIIVQKAGMLLGEVGGLTADKT